MLKIKNVSFGYIKQPLIIKDVSLSVNKNDRVLLIGGEGMGKTSFLKLLAGLEKQYVGTITYKNEPIDKFFCGKINISFLPSEPVLFENKSLEYNLKYLYKILNVEFNKDEVLSVFNKFDFNYDLKLKAKKLPLCDKRIFAMIRAYLKKPELLLIDDQVENINEENIIKIKNALDVLNACNNNLISFLVCENEHCLDVYHFNKIYYFSYSSIVKIDNIEDLKINPIDLYVKNYIGLKPFNVCLKYNNNGFYICDFDLYIDKKRKIKDYIVKKQVKMQDNFKFIADYNLADGQFVEIIVLSNESIFELTDDDFNKKINKNIFLFDKDTGVRLL